MHNNVHQISINANSRQTIMHYNVVIIINKLQAIITYLAAFNVSLKKIYVSKVNGKVEVR